MNWALRGWFLLLTIAFILVACAAGPEDKGVPSVVIGQAPLTVTFNNNSTNADEFQWDFGDGAVMNTTSIEQPVTHEYTKAGTHTVTLTAMKERGSPQTSRMTVAITVEPGPLAHVSLEPASPTVEVTQVLIA